MANMLELLNQYGNVENIPESELEINGFKRVIKDGVARLLSQKDFQNEAKNEIAMEPFWVIEFYVYAGKLKLIRNKLILHRIKKNISSDLYPKHFNSVQNDFIGQFGYLKYSYLDFTQDDWIDYFFQVENEIYAYLNALSPEGNFSELIHKPELFFNDIQADLEKNFTQFQKLKSKVLDSDILTTRLENNLMSDIDVKDFQDYIEVFETIGSEKDFHQNLQHEKLSWFDYLMYVLNLFLRQKWLHLVAEKIAGISTRNELKNALKNSVNVLPEFDQFTKLSSQIKQEKDIEKKKILSQEFSKVKALLNEQKDILLSLIEFLSYENMILENIKKYIDTISELFKVSQKEDLTESIFLDGRINEKMDKNPWEVSGDCTDGEPLPFWKLKWLSNVKVLNEEKMHIGNIYLYEAQQNGQKIRHLDAIQIPSHYDWELAISKLFEILWTQAKAKWISRIIVSKTPEHISNYDYIQHAVLKYHKEKAWKLCWGGFIKSHFYNGYKQLQSLEDDAFLVMWEE